MRAEGALRLIVLGAWILISTPPVARAAPEAVADTVRFGPPAPPGIIPAPSPAPADTSRAPAPADTSRAAVGVVPPSTRAAPTPARIAALPTGVHAPVDMTVERKLGVASLEAALPLHRAVFLARLPLFGPAEGPLALPDGGGHIHLQGWGNEAEHATDDPLLGSNALGWGAPWLAFGSMAILLLTLGAVNLRRPR